MSTGPTGHDRPLWFGTALDRAAGIRTELLERLGAEQEWLTSNEDGSTVTWCPGPNATMFQILTAEDGTLDLVSLRVVTPCFYAKNIDVARFLTWDLNLHTTLNRWVVLGDPGPSEWREGHDRTEFAEWAARIWRAPVWDSPMVIAVEATFVVGDATMEIPVSVIELVSREQIAKANALTTNDVWTDNDSLGEPVLGGGAAGTVRMRDWNDVLFHFDNVVSPLKHQSPHGVLNAIAHAHARSVEALESAGYPAWWGTSDTSATQWEVPYGPGPYPLIIANSIAGQPGDGSVATSFVRVLALTGAEANPHLGNGIIFIMRPGTHPKNVDDLAWNAALLNEQSHLFSDQVSAISAHGVGAWLEYNGEVKWSMFVPAYWAEVLSDADLARFMDEAIANTARLSWSSRVVLEPPREAGEPQPGGFAAGLRGHGPSFGETGSGINLGAELLARTWQLLVAGDAHWADRHANSFVYQLTSRAVELSTARCRCVDNNSPWLQGSLVTVSTALAVNPDQEQLVEILASQLDYGTSTIAIDDGVVRASMRLHVHADTIHWQDRFPTAFAVAQTLHAEALDRRIPDLRRSARDAEATGRTERDSILDLFGDMRGLLRANVLPSLTPAALALALLYSGSPVLGLEWHGDELAFTWLVAGEDPERLTGFTTRVRIEEHRATGVSLTIRTSIIPPVGADPVGWCLTLNYELQNWPGAVIGGFGTTAGLTEFVSTVPMNTASPSSVDAQGSFLGTMVMYHIGHVTRLCKDLAAPIGANRVARLLGEVPSSYRRCMRLPAGLRARLTDELRIVVERPHTDAQVDDNWTSLGRNEPSGVVTVLPRVDPASMRLLHSVIVASADWDGQRSPSIFSGADEIFYDDTDLDTSLRYCVGQGLLFVDDDGLYQLRDEPDGADASFNATIRSNHPAWGHVLALEVGLPQQFCSPSYSDTSCLGDWNLVDRLWIYSVSIPATALATTLRHRTSEVICAGVEDLVGAMRASWKI